MSVKDVSLLHSRAPNNRSYQSRRIKTNADIFAERGEAWNSPEIQKTPRLSPDGKLRMSPRAYLFNLMNPLPKDDHGNNHLSGDCSESADLDLDAALAEHCLPITHRLNKERNKVLAPMITGVERGNTRTVSPLLRARLQINNIRAQRLTKVK